MTYISLDSLSLTNKFGLLFPWVDTPKVMDMLVWFDFEWWSFGQSKDYLTRQKKQVPFCMYIGTVELMHECFPTHSHMGTARMK